jgi:hypothetical protein
MMNIQQAHNGNSFQQGDHVIWHFKESNRMIPVPGVVVRQESDGIVIKVCFRGTVKEQHVDADQLVAR